MEGERSVFGQGRLLHISRSRDVERTRIWRLRALERRHDEIDEQRQVLSPRVHAHAEREADEITFFSAAARCAARQLS